MDTTSNLLQQRREKADSLAEAGVRLFSNTFKAPQPIGEILPFGTALAAEAHDESGRRLRIAGRVMSMRRFGKAAFFHLQDAEHRIQVYARRDLLGEEAYGLFKKWDVGDIVGVEGSLFKTKTGELSVEATRLQMITKSLRPLPEKFHGLTDVETRYRQRYLDLIVNPEVRDTFRKRVEIIRLIREFLSNRGFMEVETPMMQPVPGGATAKPFRTHHNALDMDLYLRIAPELYLKRLLVGGFDKVFEINRNFRNEGLSTRHNPEFTMLEFYQAYATYHDLMDLTEEMISWLAHELIGTLDITYQGVAVNLAPPWRRYTMAEALSRWPGSTRRWSATTMRCWRSPAKRASSCSPAPARARPAPSCSSCSSRSGSSTRPSSPPTPPRSRRWPGATRRTPRSPTGSSCSSPAGRSPTPSPS